MSDPSNGYDNIADQFVHRGRSPIGAATVRDWARSLAPAASVLDIGCGCGVPITQVLIEGGFSVHGVDASPKMIAAFRERFPGVPAECCAAEDSQFFGQTFDGIVAWGLLFLLPAATQERLIVKAARALRPRGKFLFTSPKEVCRWADAMTVLESLSLGYDEYQRILAAEGLSLGGEQWDEGDNYYYFASKT